MVILKTRSLHKNVLDCYNLFISKLLKKANVNFSLISLPKKKTRITLLKSPHVDKKAREQFESCSHLRVVYIKSNINTDLIKKFTMNIPSSIKLEIKIGVGTL
jgi:small subunit ribosomal protein S10